MNKYQKQAVTEIYRLLRMGGLTHDQAIEATKEVVVLILKDFVEEDPAVE